MLQGREIESFGLNWWTLLRSRCLITYSLWPDSRFMLSCKPLSSQISFVSYSPGCAGVSASSVRPFAHTRVGGLETILETSTEFINALDSPVASKDMETCKGGQDWQLRGALLNGGGRVVTNLGNYPYCGLQLHPDEGSRSHAEDVLRLAKSQPQVVWASEASLIWELGQFYLDKTSLEENCELEAYRGIVHGIT